MIWLWALFLTLRTYIYYQISGKPELLASIRKCEEEKMQILRTHPKPGERRGLTGYSFNKFPNIKLTHNTLRTHSAYLASELWAGDCWPSRGRFRDRTRTILKGPVECEERGKHSYVSWGLPNCQLLFFTYYLILNSLYLIWETWAQICEIIFLSSQN